MADQPGNLLDRDAGIGKKRDKAVPQLTRRPVSRIQARRLGDLAEGAPNVRGVGGRPGPRGKHQVAIMPSTARLLSDEPLRFAMVAQHVNAALRQRQRAAGFPGLGLSPGPDRTPHHDEGRIGFQIDVRPGERA